MAHTNKANICALTPTQRQQERVRERGGERERGKKKRERVRERERCLTSDSRFQEFFQLSGHRLEGVLGVGLSIRPAQVRH